MSAALVEACQPTERLEIQTSTENTAPDIQMCLCLLTDGTKQNLTRGQKLAETEDREKEKTEIKRTEGESVTTESLSGVTRPSSCSCNQTRRERDENVRRKGRELKTKRGTR